MSLRFDASWGDPMGVPGNTFPFGRVSVLPCSAAARRMNLCSFAIFWRQAFPPSYSKNSVLAER
jgi:hypothetical protein